MEAKQSAETVGTGQLGRPLMISQIAVVTRDLKKTMEQYTKLLGWGPWNVYRHEPPRLHDTVVRGDSVAGQRFAAMPRTPAAWPTSWVTTTTSGCFARY